MSSRRKAHAIDDLKQQVLTLALAPGAALDEARLSERYGLSRTPLREVLQRLAGEGYVSIEANRGASVSSMDLAMMRNFFRSAPMVYAAVARLAAENATRAQVTALKRAQGRFRRAVAQGAVSDMAFFNHQFHEQIGEMAGNVYLLPSLGRLLIDHTRMGHVFYSPQPASAQPRVDTAADQHDEMIDAIEAGEPARAVELTLAHFELSRAELERYVQPDPLPLDGALDDDDKEVARHAL